jgi:hypothetical protein
MSRSEYSKLDLRGRGGMLPTVEVDTADDYLVACACEKAVRNVLTTFGRLSRPPRVTVYVYEGPSINFLRPTNSIFFAVAGTERVLTAIRAGLGAVDGAHVRYGDYILAERCVPRMHLEKGGLWLPSDEDVWEKADG